MTKEIARGIQTALWAALVLVQMTVVGALQVRAETVRREVTYEAVEGEAKLPDEITVSVLAGNDEELVRCRAVDQVEEDAYWRDDFSFPITFYEYGAGEYQLGEIMVKESELIDFSELTELAQQYGTELLSSMGLSEEEYEVEECGSGTMGEAETGWRAGRTGRGSDAGRICFGESGGDSRGKGGNGRGTAGRGGETAETKEVQATGISGKSDQDFADCGGNRGYLLFWRTFSACAALDLPEIAGMACAEPVKERLAAGGKIGFAF